MLYRTAAVFIVLFWLTMTGLLVHQELHPGESAFREIPVSHVVKLIFMHRQEQQHPTPLLITSDKQRIGEVRLVPKVDPETQDHNFEVHGYLQIAVPGSRRERIDFSGVVNMDKLLNIKRIDLSVKTRAPNDMETVVQILPPSNLARYEVRSRGLVADRQDFTLDEQGARAVLEHAGVDPSLLPISWKAQAAAEYTAKARLSSLSVHGGQMDTYLVTVESNGQTLLECHVDQLGRIVHASTLLGYTFAPEDITP
jgi:hypothetical protein